MTQYEPLVFDIETTGLNPMAEHWWQGSMAAQVTCIGLASIRGWRDSDDVEECEVDIKVLSSKSEYGLLMDAREVAVEMIDEIEDAPDSDIEAFLVGFNSRQFDHTYMGARFSRLSGVRDGPYADAGGYPFTHGVKRLDMMRVAGKHRELAQHPNQDDYADFLGVAVEDEHDGSDMPGYFEDGELDKIREHCERDVRELAHCFIVDREEAMEQLYDHYDLDKDANFVDTVEF